MTILIVEDNKEILSNIHEYLTLQNYTADCAQDGLTALHLLATNEYQLIILDVMLPGVDGYSICERVRQDLKSNVPIIMLTARDALDDRIRGFQSGVDDYLIKPFFLSELGARIQAILRRSQNANSGLLSVDELTLNTELLEVKRASTDINLNKTSLKILEYLMRKSPAVVRKNQIEEHIWGDDIPESDSLRTHIHQLRNAIDKPFAYPLIHTAHSIGYSVRKENDKI